MSPASRRALVPFQLEVRNSRRAQPRARRLQVGTALLALLLVLPSLASAQRPRFWTRTIDRPERGAVGASFTYGRPVGDFLSYVDQGLGFDAFFRWNVEPQGVLSFKVDGGLLIYGRESFQTPLSGTIGSRIWVDLVTSNNIVWMGFGPQLTLPGRSLRPYANASVGFSYFFTQSQLEGIDDNDAFARTTNYSDGTFRYGFGWGLLIPFETRSSTWAIDLGAVYHANGEVRYLREGGIEDLPDGSIILHPIQSEANLLTYRLGFSIGIR